MTCVYCNTDVGRDGVVFGGTDITEGGCLCDGKGGPFEDALVCDSWHELEYSDGSPADASTSYHATLCRPCYYRFREELQTLFDRMRRGDGRQGTRQV